MTYSAANHSTISNQFEATSVSPLEQSGSNKNEYSNSNEQSAFTQYFVWGEVSQLPVYIYDEEAKQLTVCNELILNNIEIDEKGEFTGYYFSDDSHILERYQKDIQFKRMISAEEFRCITTLSDLNKLK